MSCPRLRELVKAHAPAFGVWITLAEPAVVELASYAGFDHVYIDMEHSSLDMQTVESLLRASTAANISALVRVPENNAKTILRVAELGPDGIMIPHIRDADDALAAVSAARYAPMGDRGISSATRAAGYGALAADFAEYARRTNEELLLYAMIEDRSAVDDIEAIAAIQGLDIVAVAPADLARSLGHMGTHNHPEVGAMIDRLVDSIRNVGKAAVGMSAMHYNYEYEVSTLLSMGVRVINCGTDSRFLLRALKDSALECRTATEPIHGPTSAAAD
jgi:4-hydroxy-2-oxoheptanedioate aldolase